MARLQAMAAFSCPRPPASFLLSSLAMPEKPPHYRPTGLLPTKAAMSFNRTDSAAFLAGQLARAFARSLQTHAASLGFSPGQWPILLELWSEDGLTQRQLIDRVGIEQATMANTLARMERDGLIQRRPHPSDRRAQQVFLTDQARAMEARAIEAACAADDAMFAGFRRFERELLLEYIRMVIANSRRESAP